MATTRWWSFCSARQANKARLRRFQRIIDRRIKESIKCYRFRRRLAVQHGIDTQAQPRYKRSVRLTQGHVHRSESWFEPADRLLDFQPQFLPSRRIIEGACAEVGYAEADR